jgi:predicted enzyme related to lactoylglutathione lyase
MSRRLVGFMIDCQDAAIGPAAKFWSGALGLPVEDPDEGGDGRYALLGAGPGGLHVEVQSVAHESRLHLDIEADDIDAEADAIEALGATRVGKPHGRWWVMDAPSGHRFCIVRRRDREFPARARRSALPMRHHSVLIALVIDCQVDDLEPALRFWSAALQRPIASHDQDGDGRYGELESGPGEVFVLLQRVSHPSRVHLDIQADDQDAEVARLEKLGATREQFLKRWWILRAPTGHRFCVVRQQSPKPAITPNTWGRRA